MQHRMILFPFSLSFSVLQLQDCIQATLTDWLSSTKPPSEVGESSSAFCLSLNGSVRYDLYCAVTQI